MVVKEGTRIEEPEMFVVLPLVPRVTFPFASVDNTFRALTDRLIAVLETFRVPPFRFRLLAFTV